jgi:hypothetical protein
MAKEEWQYIAHHYNKSAVVTVLMPNGTMAPITHLAVDNAQKTLGVVTCLSGNSGSSLRQMKEKAQKWLDSLTAGRLHCQMMRFSIDHQLWPSVKYGLCCSMATLPELEDIPLPFYGKCFCLVGLSARPTRGYDSWTVLLRHGLPTPRHQGLG